MLILCVICNKPARNDDNNAGSKQTDWSGCYKETVESHLSSDGMLTELITRPTEKIKTVVFVVGAVLAATKPLSDKVARLKNEVIHLKTKLWELDTNTIERANDLEQYQCWINLRRIFRIEETSDKDTDDLLQQLCHKKLGIMLAHAIHPQESPGSPATDGS